MANADDDKITKALEAIRIHAPKRTVDPTTILGFFSAVGLIALALFLGGSAHSFFNIPSLLIVIGGTVAVSIASFRAKDIAQVPYVVGQSLFKQEIPTRVLTKQLLDIASFSKKAGVLRLQQLEKMLRRNPFLDTAIQYVSDGYTATDVERALVSELTAIKKRHEQSAEILYKAAETAPAMGLIGTLVGLVQMLANLDDPTTIGPSMAVALLTTFYGAVLGTVILSPLAAKLERNSLTEEKEKRLIVLAAISMAKQENPRKLEIQLNSEVSPDERIRYFENKTERR